MNMSRNLFILLTIFISFLSFNINVYATTTRVVCNNFKNKTQCNGRITCSWDSVNNVCREEFVAAEPCEDNNIKTALRFFGIILLIAKVAIPLIIIVMGTFDFYKSVVDKDEKSLNKQLKTFIMRIVAGLVVFFIPTIVYALFNLSSSLNIVNEQKYKACMDCLLDPNDGNKCKIETK